MFLWNVAVSLEYTFPVEYVHLDGVKWWMAKESDMSCSKWLKSVVAMAWSLLQDAATPCNLWPKEMEFCFCIKDGCQVCWSPETLWRHGSLPSDNSFRKEIGFANWLVLITKSAQSILLIYVSYAYSICFSGLNMLTGNGGKNVCSWKSEHEVERSMLRG